MNTETRQWSTAAGLCHPVSNASAAVCNDCIYVMDRFNKFVYRCNLSTLLESCSSKSSSIAWPRLQSTNSSVWKCIMDVKASNATCVSLNGQLLVVGGNTSPTTPIPMLFACTTQALTSGTLSAACLLLEHIALQLPYQRTS